MISKKIKSLVTASIIPILLLTIGLFIYKDYGISWDDPIQRKLGLDTYNYVTKKDTKLLTNADRLYGSFFELILIIVEKTSGMTDSQGIYFTRHLSILVLFVVSVFFFQLICLDYFEKKSLAFFATMALIISPRIFAHSFYNSKDIPNMAFFIITIYFATKFIKKQNLKNAVALAITTGMLISIRLTGIFIPILVATLTFPYKLTNRAYVYKKLSYLCIYLALIPIFTIIFWPSLWEHPVIDFISAIKTMSNFSFAPNTRYFGINYKKNIPWHYLFGWIFISTQISYSLGFIAGIYHFFKNLFKPITKIFTNKSHLLVFGWFFLPVVSTITTKTPLYDAWRHMFFVYPAFLLISIEGIRTTIKLFKKRLVKTAIITLIFLDILGSAIFMVKQHPFQNIYFNPLVKNLQENFYLDYWGLSYKQGLEFILEKDNRKKIKVYAKNVPARYNLMILDPTERQRLEVSEDIENPDYFITNYKGHDDEQDEHPLIHEIKVKDLSILGIYDLSTF